MDVPRAKRILIALLACLATAGIATRATGDDGLGFDNMDFERGTEPWAIYYGEDPEAPRFPWGLDADVVKSGKASLRIVACDYQGRATVHQSTTTLVPGRRYRVEYWIKVSDPEMAVHCDLKLNFRKPKADGQGEDLVSVVPAMLSEAGENGWSVRRGAFTVDKEAVSAQIALCVRDAVGTVWFDDVRLQDASQAEVRVESIYHYAPEQVQIGPAMVDRFSKVFQSRPDLIERAKVYNQRLVDVAQLTEQSRRLRRASGYLEEGGQTADISAELSASAQIEAKLNQLHQTYSRLLLSKTPPQPGEFDRSAEALAQAVQAAADQIASKLRALQETARRAGADWTAPEETPARPVVVAADGTPNQLVFGKVSLQSHYALEEPLAVNRLAHMPLMEIKGEGLGKYDFGSLLVSWSYLQKLGARQSALGTPFAVHSNQVAPEWFLDKYGDDPDIFMRGADGTRALRPSWSFGAPLNTWRPEVREMTTDQTPQGAKYLWVINANVAQPVTDTVTLAGRFQHGIDLDVPGGFPVPFCHDEKHTSFRLSLEPGEFTLIALD